MNKKSICCFLRPLREKVAEGRMRGFTLIELLVVVIIIAILAAIAVPQYKHAALKSRFSTVMPMAKAIADAQEVYYQGRQLYALDVDELDVTPVNAENTSVSLSQTDGYDYVMAQNSQVPGANYIIYQKYSENYPSEIHCEAADDNADAQWLCGVLSNNNSIGETITRGYTTYVLSGEGIGIPLALLGLPTCDQAESMGLTCNISKNAQGQTTKSICTTVGNQNICRTKTYNEDGSYTSITCKANSNGVCTSNLKTSTYDENGNQLAVRECRTIDSNGNCAAYSSGTDYMYNSDGKVIAKRLCQTVSADRSCTYYNDNSTSWDYKYDENGNMVAELRCDRNGLAEDGSCNRYYGYGSYNYTYNENGEQTSKRVCDTIISNGTCRNYLSGPYADNLDYTYDADGKMIYSRRCTSVASDGSCSAYDSSRMEYTYDTNGNKFAKQCQTIESDGSCSSYDVSGTYYEYDTDGNEISQKTFNVKTDGTINYYVQINDKIYDDDGKLISKNQCYNNSGQCTTYSSVTTTFN